MYEMQKRKKLDSVVQRNYLVGACNPQTTSSVSAIGHPIFAEAGSLPFATFHSERIPQRFPNLPYPAAVGFDSLFLNMDIPYN
jgi:hypothetical protein